MSTVREEPAQRDSGTHANEQAVRHSSRNGQQSSQPNNAAPTRSSWLSRWERKQLRHVLSRLGDPPIGLALWTGEEITADAVPEIVVRVHNRLTLWKLLLEPWDQFGEAYSAGRLDVDGNLLDLLTIVEHALAKTGSPRESWFSKWSRRGRRNTLAGSRKNIHHHYDISNDFYKLWLDDQLVYTCAYYDRPDMSLEEAQIAKLDHVCRKVRLQPGESVIEAGCGWGALALHMARHYGVTVRAFNISHEQIVYARDRARAEGLDHRVEFVEDDWRNITGRCDAFVSVGMLEHVGLENYRQLGGLIGRLLPPNGRGLIHTIGQNFPRQLNSWIERRIFPGAQPPAFSDMAALFEPFNFSLLDVENLRLHYAQTLRHWLERFEESADTVQEMFDESFVRTWRLYLASSAAAFETGWLQLFQVLFAPGASNHVPRNRRYQYAPTELPAWRDEFHAACLVPKRELGNP